MDDLGARSEPRYVAFDLETTGLSARSDRIIEIGAVKFDREGVVETFSTLTDPGIPLPLVVQRLCGLRDSDLAGQPTPEEGVAQLAMFCDGCLVVGHGISFDLAFCAEILPDVFARRSAVDTSELARVFLPAAPSHSLEELGRSFHLLHDNPHRALSDAEATRMLLWRLVAVVREMPGQLQQRVRDLCLGQGWTSGEFMAAQLDPAAAPQAAPPARAQGPIGREPADAGPLDARWIVDALGADGPLARADPVFELREEQQQMAVAVTQAFNRGQELLVEAGTGVGKSLAYLLPAREWAARRGERVVISTHTITLQEQLMAKDLPILETARPLPVRAVVLKGRGNYLSLRRMERWLRARPAGRHLDLDELKFKVRLVVWAQQTSTGDRTELRLAGRDSEFWEMVGSNVDDCLGPACHNWRDRRCFMARARLDAREADLVVVNHALLLADADSGGTVLPEFHRLVVDEAHHLEEAATQAQSQRLNLRSLLAVIDRLPELGSGDLPTRLKSARQAATAGFGDLRALAAADSARAGGTAHVVVDRRQAGKPAWQRCAKSLHKTVRELEAAVAALRTAAQSESLQGALWPQPDNAGRECSLAADALQGMARLLTQALAEAAAEPGPASGQVVWVELERGDRAVLRTAPVAVAQTLREQLFDHCETAVLTSATLAIAGSFQYLRERLGLEGAEELILASPFDYLHQSLCCLPRGMPGHGDPRHAGVVAQLVAEVAETLGGRTLVLFTGYAALREVHAQLRSRLNSRGIVVLGQGLDGTRNQLLRNFRNNARTVLMGTSSFWEGIDLPGDVLQCVVIDKLPFPVPTDPIYQARSRGRSDAFAQLALPEAVLRLKQGFGRLVRGHGDRGAVVICDPRILERSYGESFVQALPRATFNYDPVAEVAEVVGRFILGRVEVK
ncbi:MAG TPA: helicase C-terminal domain-containing protein [Candidatus Nanopelagicaceae bacterium]|nr:helicase C-terminal domain-containing protein [Candidatus Nanopelagicaceae bacterium]